MTIITNDVLIGTMASARSGIGSGFIPGGVANITLGDPNDKCPAVTGSDIVWNSVSGTYHMALAGVGGSTWIALGSVSF